MEESKKAEGFIEILFKYEGSKLVLVVTLFNLAHTIKNELKDGFRVVNATISCSRDETLDSLIQKWCPK